MAPRVRPNRYPSHPSTALRRPLTCVPFAPVRHPCSPWASHVSSEARSHWVATLATGRMGKEHPVAMLSRWYGRMAALVTGVIAALVVPAVAWASTSPVASVAVDTVARKKLSTKSVSGVGGILCLLCCLAVVGAIVGIVMLIMKKRKGH